MGRGRYQWLVGLAFVALAAFVGVYAYNAGVAHGIAESGRVVLPGVPGAAPGAAAPIVAWYPHPWGFGFGFFPFFPFLFILFWFVVLRGLFWRGRWHRGWDCGGVPPAFDEWHRRAHAQQGTPAPDVKA